MPQATHTTREVRRSKFRSTTCPPPRSHLVAPTCSRTVLGGSHHWSLHLPYAAGRLSCASRCEAQLPHPGAAPHWCWQWPGCHWQCKWLQGPSGPPPRLARLSVAIAEGLLFILWKAIWIFVESSITLSTSSLFWIFESVQVFVMII